MSSSAAGGAGGGQERPGGFSRFIRRASSVLRRDKTKRQSVSGTTALTPAKDDSATTTAPLQAQPAVQEATTTPPAVDATVPPLPSKDDSEEPKPEFALVKPKSAMTAAENNRIQEEKARALFAKYNMTLEIGDWTPPFKSDAVRVERKIRMRIHRHCHRCQTMFGLEKQCAECGHTRCKKCPRTKMARQRDWKGKSMLAGGMVVDDRYMGVMGPDILNMPYRRTTTELSGAARRICHKCQTTFTGSVPQCEACGHQRCPQCPQDPPLSPPTADESQIPRRRQLHPLRVRIRFTCHECQKTFKDLETKCSKCGHAKCGSCPRDPAVEDLDPDLLEQDPEALRSLEERLRNLDVSEQAAAA